MVRFTEDQLISFTKPASDTEEQKLENAKKAIKTAINNDSKLSQKIEIFGQGSYANDTNVKNNSDIDINVMYKEGFYYKIPPNTKKEDFGIVNTFSYSFKEFKNDVEQALLNNFKGFKVNRKNKCISINIYGIDVDVVPTCTHRIFFLNGNFVEGVTLFTDNTLNMAFKRKAIVYAFVSGLLPIKGACFSWKSKFLKYFVNFWCKFQF